MTRSPDSALLAIGRDVGRAIAGLLMMAAFLAAVIGIAAALTP